MIGLFCKLMKVLLVSMFMWVCMLVGRVLFFSVCWCMNVLVGVSVDVVCSSVLVIINGNV